MRFAFDPMDRIKSKRFDHIGTAACKGGGRFFDLRMKKAAIIGHITAGPPGITTLP